MKSRWFINLLAYIAVVLICISLVVGFLSRRVFDFPSEVAYWCNNIAMYLGIIVTVFSAFLYASSKRNGMFKVVLFLLVVAIIVFLVIWKNFF